MISIRSLNGTVMEIFIVIGNNVFMKVLFLSFFYGGPQLSHQKQIPHIKIKFTTSNTNSPQQKQNRDIKNKFPTSKSNLPHQTQIRHNKSKIVTTKANSPHQKRTCHIKNKFFTAKTNSSHQNRKHRLNGQRSMNESYLQFSLGLHPTAILFLHMVLLSCSGCIAAIAGEV